jgi:hypothetical protein
VLRARRVTQLLHQLGAQPKTRICDGELHVPSAFFGRHLQLANGLLRLEQLAAVAVAVADEVHHRC